MGILKCMSEMWKTGELCDIVIVVDKEKFPVHKVALAASSSFFRTMFTSEFQEKNKSEIELVGQSAACFKNYLYFIYNGHVDLTPEIVEGVYEIAMFLQAEELIDLCIVYMLNNANATFILHLFLKNQCNQSKFYGKAVKMIAKNFFQVAEDESFYSLRSEVMKDVLQQEDFADVSEEYVLKIVLKWLDLNKADSVLVCEILEHVRWGLLASADLQTMQHNPYITGNEICQKIVQKAIDYLEDEKLQPLRGGLFCTPRGLPALVAFGGWADAGYDSEGICESVAVANEHELVQKGALDPYLSHKRNTVKDMPMPVQYSHCGSSVVINNILFLVGGCVEDEATREHPSISCNHVLKYNPLLNRWSMMAPLICPRSGHAAVAVEYPDGNARIMAIGGYDECWDHVGIATVALYDIQNDSWTEEHRFPDWVFAPAACVFKGSVYVSGGKRNGSRSSKNMYRFTPESPQWVPLSRMLARRFGHAMGVVNDRIFIVGSDDELYCSVQENYAFAEIYDPQTDQYTKVDWISCHRKAFDAVFLKDRIYSMFGSNVCQTAELDTLNSNDRKGVLYVLGGRVRLSDPSLALLHLPYKVPSDNNDP